MLVLGRKLEEQIVINGGEDNQIVMKVTEIRGDRVWLAFEAPSSVRIDRMEVHLARGGGAGTGGRTMEES